MDARGEGGRLIGCGGSTRAPVRVAYQEIGPVSHPRTRISPWAHVLSALIALALLCPGAAHAVTLKPGDVILLTSTMDTATLSHVVYQLDPTTLATTLIGADGLLVHPARITIDHRGMILVADATSGIVQVDPASGSQTQLISVAQLGGGVPFGICAAADNSVFITMRTGAASLLHFVPGTGSLATVCSGGLLTNPGGLTFGPDGMLYVCEMSSPAVGNSQGSIVRIDPTSGTQTQVAACSAFYAPFDIAFVTSDVVWTTQFGQLSRRMGGFVSTRLSDGVCEGLSFTADHWSEGVAADSRGKTYVSSCHTVSFTCYYPWTLNYATNDQIQIGGSIAIVPDLVTPVLRSTWGRLKTIYR